MTRRRHEYGLCSALGASRSRLLRQAFLEHVVLGTVGAFGGLGLAWVLVTAAHDYLPAAFLVRSLNPVGLDLRAVLMTTAAGLVAIVAAGWLPAWLGTRLDAMDSMRATERGGTETRGARHATWLLLVSEVALACTLLIGATLLVRTFANLSSVNRGLNTEGVLTAWASLPSDVFADRDARLAAVNVLEQTLRVLPGVRAVALSYGAPPSGGGWRHSEDWRAHEPDARAHDIRARISYVGPDFFDLYEIPLLAGRPFAPGDGEHTVIMGERLAGILWPHQNPVGRSFTDGQQSYEVVGLVGEVALPSLEADVDLPELYWPYEPGGRQLFFNMRCDATCPSVALVRERLLSAAAGVQVHRIGFVEEAFAEQLARPRASAAAALVFAGIAVLAAAGGLFSVLSYTVGRRRREFGIRMALGASPRVIRSMVLRDGLVIAAVGIAFGVAGAWVLGRAVASLLYGVTLGDSLNWVFVAGILTAATVGASWLPARQAGRSDPLRLLRDE